MIMLPLCSATPSCSSQSQLSLYGGLQPFCPFRKDVEVKYITEEGLFSGLYCGTHSLKNTFKTQAAKSIYSGLVKSTDKSVSVDFLHCYSCPNESEYLRPEVRNSLSLTPGSMNEIHPLGGGSLNYVENTEVSAIEERMMALTEGSAGKENILIEPSLPEIRSSADIMRENMTSTSQLLNTGSESLSSTKSIISDQFAGINESFSAFVNKGQNSLKSSLDMANSSIKSIVDDSARSAQGVLNKALSSFDRTGEFANGKLSSFSSDFKEVTSEARAAAIDLLRHTIVAVENFLISGASFVIYSYGSTKEMLPGEIKDVVNLYEEKAITLLRPIGTVFQEVYIAIQGLGKSLGLDPNDPIVPFIVFLSSSATVWVIYWFWSYGGYSGDLSPTSTLELLTGKENAILVDVRHEALRERDGIPDLRRTARFRYASVAPLEVDGSVRKMLKGGRDLEDSIIASIVLNLRIFKDSSKVVVMDADGAHSKGIARSLRKLGVKNPYLVHGGFRSWVNQGLRVKELKPETTLSILNEEAEAILEDINPTPVQVLAYGVGLIATLYALLEWEKTLQYIGLFGLGQTIFRRVASYEDSEDLKRDVRLLLAPARLGAQAFSWAVGKLDTDRVGLPTSPSSTDVQNRVLQAAAKHESQPSDADDIQDQSPESTVPVNENVDLSEA